MYSFIYDIQQFLSNFTILFGYHLYNDEIKIKKRVYLFLQLF